MKKTRFAILCASALALTALNSAQAAVLNEIRIDNTGGDEEYFEIKGTNGEDLSAMTLISIGDGAGGSGVIEKVIPLTGTIGSDGLYLVTSAAYESGGTIKGLNPSAVADQTGADFTFENGDNMTFLLVTGFTGAAGDDLDTNDDGTLDSTPWTTIIDDVASILSPDTPPVDTEYAYSTNRVGPDGSFAPGHIYRDGSTDEWKVGVFDPESTDPAATDTPDAANPTTSSVSDWTLY